MKSVQHFAGTWLAGSLLKTDFETGVYMPPWNAKGKTKIPIVATETGWGVSEGPHKKQAIMLLDWINGKGFHYYQNARGNIPHLKDPMGPVKLDDRIKTYLDKLYSYKQTAGLWFEYIPAETMHAHLPAVPGSPHQSEDAERGRRRFRQGRQGRGEEVG